LFDAKGKANSWGLTHHERRPHRRTSCRRDARRILD
jgi:hypothetical protein